MTAGCAPAANATRAAVTDPASAVRDESSSAFLGPGDRDWTEDGAAGWLIGDVGGLSYSVTDRGADSHLTLHNRGLSDLAVLSFPGLSGTSGTRLTLLPHGVSAPLPDMRVHIVQARRRNGRPVMVGQIIDDGEPDVLLHPHRPQEVDWTTMPGADEFWTARGALSPVVDHAPSRREARRGDFAAGGDFAEGSGIDCVVSGGAAVVHNRGSCRIAVLMTGLGGAYDLVIAYPGESVPIPPGPGIHYVQEARRAGRPAVVEVLHIAPGR